MRRVLGSIWLCLVLGCSSRPIPDCGGGPLSIAATGNHNLTGARDSYSVDFGSVAVNENLNVALSLENVGCSPAQIFSVGAPSDPEFGLTLSNGTVVEVGATVIFVLVFKPFSVGHKAATVTLQTDSASVPTITLTLTGTGVTLDGGL